MTTWLHRERLAAVLAVLRAAQPVRVLDLGCGDGDLFVQLAQNPGITELTGIEIDAAALDRLRQRLRMTDTVVPRITVRAGSLTDPAPDLAGFDCAVMVEVIEHLPPDRLSLLDRALFHRLRPKLAVLTTPNAEFNPLLGVPPHRFRHPDHRFEWTRARFRAWCARVAGTAGYGVQHSDIAGCHPDLGGASQMAVFRRGAAGQSGARGA